MHRTTATVVRVAAVDGSSNSSAPVKMDDTFSAETVGLEGLRRVTLSFDVCDFAVVAVFALLHQPASITATLLFC